MLVERGLAGSRQKAQAMLLAGQVLVDCQKVDKPGCLVDVEAEIRVLGELPFASRAGSKLQAALDHFQINVSGRICADLGASTGGFTDCLLQNGAAKVHAFDVGKGLLDWRLRSDNRVVLHEGFNVRHITPSDLPDPVSLVTIDLSFISVTKVLLPLKNALQSGGEGSERGPIDLVLLVKPQFEVGKGEVGKRGIVRDPEKRLAVLIAVTEFAVHAGYRAVGSIRSPITGAKGNLEFLLYLQLNPGLSSPS